MMPLPKSVIANPACRILVRATNWIGDAVMTMPAVQRLRELAPEAHIAVLCPAKLQDLWLHHPAVTKVIPFAAPPRPLELRAGEFDFALLFPNSFRTAWEVHQAQIPVRVGFAGHWRRLLLTHVVPEPRDEQVVYRTIEVGGQKFRAKHFPRVRHQVYRYLDLVGAIGGNRQYTPPKIFIAFEELPPLTKFFRDDGRPVLGLNPGAEFGPAKRWLPARFADVAVRVHEEVPCRWLLLGGRADWPIAAEIEQDLLRRGVGRDAVINVAGQTSLRELLGLLRLCRLLLTNDTGPMHLAAALGTPVVALFGSTSAELTGPLGTEHAILQHKVECNPCFLPACPIDFRCMTRIETDEVVRAVLAGLAASMPRPGSNP
jgi:heptosyltransferase-2